MIKADSVSLETNLRDFSYFLQGRGIQHRINEESGHQVIWVDGEAEAEFVRSALQTWSFDQFNGERPPTTLKFSSYGILRPILQAFLDSPISLCLILACLLVALVSQLGVRADRVDFLFYPRLASDGFFALLASIDSLQSALRTLTPMFLHFGELHLVFNMLWLWYFGKQLEAIHPAWLVLALALMTSFAGNTTQYLYSNYNNFGGMSGVVYGLVGYTWIIHSFMPRSQLLLNNTMFVVFVIALIAMEILASSWIASAAHVGGLVMGLLLGVCMVVYYRLVLRRNVISK